MSTTTTLMHTSASAWRRHSILEAVVGSALLAVAVLSALQAETWHAMLAGFAAGATLSAAVITFGKARLWERVAASRESKSHTGEGQPA